jgi:hypothetical protein
MYWFVSILSFCADILAHFFDSQPFVMAWMQMA